MELMLRSLINERQTGVRMEMRSTKANQVRRNLFGPVDHDILQEDFQRMLCASMEKAKQRWNFDFLHDLPAEGLLQWEELQDHKVPAFYHTCVVGEVCKPLQPMNQAVAKVAKAHHVSKVKLVEKPRPAKKMPRKKNLTGKKQRQTYLTDDYTTKKQIRTDMQTPVKKLTF